MSRIAFRFLCTLLDGWGYFDLERVLDSIDGHLRLLILLLVLSVLVSVVLFALSFLSPTP